MPDRLKTARTHTVGAVQKPVNSWRQSIAAAGAVVAKPWRRYRARLFQGYMVGAIIAFLILAVLAHTIAYFAFDVTITRAVQRAQADWFDSLMRFLTWLGFPPQAYLITAIILLFLYISGLKWETLVSTASILGISALGTILKLIVQRPRPTADLVTVISQLKEFSFPSGHVLFFTVFFGFLLFLAYTLLTPSWWRTGLLIILTGLVSLIGLSRVYAGQHWASDVLAAYLLGSVWLGLSVKTYRWGKPRFFVDQPVAQETPGAG